MTIHIMSTLEVIDLSLHIIKVMFLTSYIKSIENLLIYM